MLSAAVQMSFAHVCMVTLNGLVSSSPHAPSDNARTRKPRSSRWGTKRSQQDLSWPEPCMSKMFMSVYVVPHVTPGACLGSGSVREASCTVRFLPDFRPVVVNARTGNRMIPVEFSRPRVKRYTVGSCLAVKLLRSHLPARANSSGEVRDLLCRILLCITGQFETADAAAADRKLSDGSFDVEVLFLPLPLK